MEKLGLLNTLDCFLPAGCLIHQSQLGQLFAVDTPNERQIPGFGVKYLLAPGSILASPARQHYVKPLQRPLSPGQDPSRIRPPPVPEWCGLVAGQNPNAQLNPERLSTHPRWV